MAGKKKETAGSTQAKSRKKQEAVLELYWVWKEGDNIEQVAQALTGHSYNVFNLLNYNHIQAQDIKPGVVIKWGIR